MLFWNYFQYIGLSFIPALWVLFSLTYNNKQLRFVTKICLFVIPILTLFFRYTSSMNHLYYASTKVTMNEFFSVLYIQKGPWYWVQSIFITFCFIISNYLYYDKYQKSTGLIRRQSLILLIASFLPWISLLLDLFNISPFDIDLGAFALTSSVLLFFIAFLRYQFLNIKPLARDKVFESTDDAIIVLDTNYHIIDYNPSAASICSALNDNPIGMDVREVLGEHEGLMHSIFNSVESQCDVNEPKSNYRVNTVKISEANGRMVGYIATLTDITKYIDMMEKLNYLASRDALTGVYNRRQFNELSLRELKNSGHNHHPLSMIILDLDYFKKVNDNYGHQAGDLVLQKVAAICRNSIRSSDILGRYGGEEFIIFLPEITLEDCQMISNRILSNIAATEILYEGKCIKVTASIGIVGINTVTNESLDYFLKRADQALYLAKSDGRNCVRSIAV
jgi:diguanylate cyclase (GGDEF)-like protein